MTKEQAEAILNPQWKKIGDIKARFPLPSNPQILESYAWSFEAVDGWAFYIPNYKSCRINAYLAPDEIEAIKWWVEANPVPPYVAEEARTNAPSIFTLEDTLRKAGFKSVDVKVSFTEKDPLRFIATVDGEKIIFEDRPVNGNWLGEIELEPRLRRPFVIPIRATA